MKREKIQESHILARPATTPVSKKRIIFKGLKHTSDQDPFKFLIRSGKYTGGGPKAGGSILNSSRNRAGGSIPDGSRNS